MKAFPERILDLVVAPSPERLTIGPQSAVGTVPACVAVLVGPADACAGAAAVALSLVCRARQSCALAVSWGASNEEPLPVGAFPAATRLARRLSQSGVEAVAAGRIVRVRISGPADTAIADWRRLAGEGVPVAIALAGSRCEELDLELRNAERILVLGGSESPPGLVDAAEADALAIGPRVTTASLRFGAATRAMLALGYGAPPRIRRAIDRALQ